MIEMALVLNGELEREQFENRDDIVSVYIKDETTIPASCFRGCKSLKSVTLGEKVEDIDCFAFEDCISLETVYVQSEKISIAPDAFKNCAKLVDNGLLSRSCRIYSNAFQGCTSLESISLGKNLEEIDVSAFLEVPFKRLSIEHNKRFFIKDDFLIERNRYPHKKTTYKALFYFGNHEKVVIPDEVTMLSNMCFKLRNCKDRIREITLPANLNTLEDDEANDDEFLMDEISSMRENGASVVIPQASDAIVSNVFDKCRKLKKFHVSKKNKSFCAKNGVLYSKDGLTLVKLPPAYEDRKFVIPKNVVSIGNRAFSGCVTCNEIIIHGGIKKIGYCVFADSSVMSVSCPDSEYGSIFVENDGLYYIIKNKMFRGGLKCLVFYNRDAKQVHIMPDTNIIREYAFQGCKNLKEFTCSLAYKHDLNPEIMEYAFKECTSLTTFSFPNGVEYVSDGCFENCYKLQQINFPEELYLVGQAFLKGIENRVRIVIRSKHESIFSSDFAFDGFKGGITIDIRSSEFNANQYMDFLTDAPDTFYEVGEFGRSKYRVVDGMLLESLRGIGTLLVRVPSELGYFSIKDENLRIEEIGKCSFDHCKNLRFVDIPDTVKVVNEGTIQWNEKLKAVRLPENVQIQKYDYRTDRPLKYSGVPMNEKNVGSFYYSRIHPLTIIGNRLCIEDENRTVNVK